MATTISQIDAWRAARSEHQNLEFKEAKTQFDNRKLYKYCVALANEGGGHLLLGIEDQPPRKVVGTSAFNDPVGMAAKMFRALGFRVEIEEVAQIAAWWQRMEKLDRRPQSPETPGQRRYVREWKEG